MRSRPCFIGIVEDDALMRNGIRRLLEARDFDTEAFDSAEQFLATPGATAASCLVVDIGLTGMSGIEFKRHMTQVGQATPFIFITAVDDARVHAQAYQAGCVTLLLKPFRAVELIAAINTALS
jgi:FixJ family two-component response regulator